MPQISTASACEVIERLWSPNMWPSMPRNCGWAWFMLTSDQSAPQTSAPQTSARRVSSACASDAATPSPAMIIGRDPPASNWATRSTSAGTGATRVDGNEDGSTCSSLGASRTSIGRDTKTGPIGGVPASLMALRSTRRSDPGSTTRVAHFVTGSAIATRSAHIWASMAS